MKLQERTPPSAKATKSPRQLGINMPHADADVSTGSHRKRSVSNLKRDSLIHRHHRVGVFHSLRSGGGRDQLGSQGLGVFVVRAYPSS